MIRLHSRSFWFVLAIVTASFCALPVTAQASQKQCDPDMPDHCAQPLTKGEMAPFSGQLLTPELAIDLGQKADGCDVRVKIESNRVQKLAEIDVTLARRLLEIERDAARRQVDLLTERLKEAEDVSFYERPVFVATVAVVATIAVVAVTAYGLNAVQ
jgi:hypothetical protein